MIPKYIVKKIVRQNELLRKAAALEEEIDAWYAKYTSRFDYALEDLRDEDFCDIKYVGAMCISIENIEYNINLLKENMKR